MAIARRDLVRLTAAKAVSNVAYRWLPFFLFVLEDAFDATTAQLTLILGLGEMLGLGTLLIGGQLDQGRERRFLVMSMIMVSGSGLIGLGGTLWTFAISFLFVIAGVSLVTVSGHTWLSRRVLFEQRGRAIGIFEMSWASALLVGAPIIALLIELFGWRAPFVALAIAGAVMAVVISRLDDGTVLADSAAPTPAKLQLPRRAMALIAMSASIATAGLSTIVIVGTWLEDEFAISTGEVGLTAMAFGVAEILSSGSSARFADQLGKNRTTLAALVALMAGLGVMMIAGSSFAVAVLGLALFFLGFEYAIVTSFSIVSEGAPEARGRVLATNNAVSTLARGSGTVAAGVLYGEFGVQGPAVLSMAAAALAFTLLAASSR